MKMIELNISVDIARYSGREERKMAFNIDNISYIGASKKFPKKQSFMRLKDMTDFFEVMHSFSSLLHAIREELNRPLK